jgi:hypothetical protein
MTDYPTRGMKAKTIKAILAKKFTSFTASIEDESVRKMVEKNTIITGGCIASMLLGEKINDFDLYFTDRATTEAVAKYYVSRFSVKKRNGIDCAIYVESDDAGRVRIIVKSSGVASEGDAETPYNYFEGSPEGEGGGYVSELMSDAGDIEDAYQETEKLALENDDPTYRPIFMSTNAITLSDKIQIVLRFYGDADKIHENYDFVHCTNYWTSGDGNLVLRQPALESLLCKELRYVGSKYPVCSVIRLRKFIKRGWVVNAGQILKMMMQVSNLNLTDTAVLQDQLTGVDSAYFIELMSKVKDKDPDKVNHAYLVEIIDRMF